MSRRWHIKAGDVHGGSNKKLLIGCSLARDSHTREYFFMGPKEDGLPLASIKMPVHFPFWFPKFTSELSGTVPLDWYIRVDWVDGGPDLDKAHGGWRNIPPPDSGEGDTDTDTWTTQAGVGVDSEGDKKDQKAAASASLK